MDDLPHGYGIQVGTWVRWEHASWAIVRRWQTGHVLGFVDDKAIIQPDHDRGQVLVPVHKLEINYGSN